MILPLLLRFLRVSDASILSRPYTGIITCSSGCVVIPGVYLSLNADIIPNHGYVLISDIGSTEDTALICHTNRPAFDNNGQSNSGGDWFGPDRTAVGTRYSNEHAVPGVRRNRGPGMVQLIRYTTNFNPSLNGMTFTPPEGIYHCEVEDATLTQQKVYVGLYNSGGGMCVYTYIVYVCGCMSPYLSLFQEISQCLHSPWTLTSVEPILSSPSPVSPLVDLLPLSLGPETLILSLKELRLC